jgi:hypothetical protein
MILVFNSEVYYGVDAIHILSLLSADSSFLRKFNKKVFQSQSAAKILYPKNRKKNFLKNYRKKSNQSSRLMNFYDDA